VYTSPVVRAVETARIIAEPHRLEVAQVDGVAELDHGRWTDRPLAQMRRTKHFTYVVRTPSRVALPEGESFVAAQARAVAAVEDIVAAHPERETVVVTSHADVIKLLVAHYVGMPIDAFQRLVVAPASLTRLVLPKRGDARLVSFNDVAHLSG
jgi:broad specificity phosphatase PhoE